MSWLKISLTVPSQEADATGDELLAAGAVAVSVTAAESSGEALLEPGPGELPLWRQNQLAAEFPLETDFAVLRGVLETVLSSQVLATLDVDFSAPGSNTDAWRSHAVLRKFGNRLWVAPKDATVADADAVLRLDPGLAFGTGGHQTTALCLEWLAEHPPAGHTVLDFGCGSGILAIAACLLGAAHVYAVDHDPQALVATRENATYNGVDASQLTVAERPGAAITCNLIVANILANPLIILAPELTDKLPKGGVIVLSGVLREQVDEVCSAYPQISFEEPVFADEWVRLVGSRI